MLHFTAGVILGQADDGAAECKLQIPRRHKRHSDKV